MEQDEKELDFISKIKKLSCFIHSLSTKSVERKKPRRAFPHLLPFSRFHHPLQAAWNPLARNDESLQGHRGMMVS